MKDKEKLNGKTVLVVDDDTDILEQMKLILGNAGFQVDTCESRRDAEEYIAGSQPDIAIVDLMMETSDAGFVLCHHLKKKYPGLPLIVFTATSAETGVEFDTATVEERSWIKADVIMHKPARPEQILREVNRLLHADA
jgi:CheY-like chemotaxis protein